MSGNRKRDQPESFYVLGTALTAAAYRGTTDVKTYDAMLEAACGEIPLSIKPVITYHMGGKLKDFVWVSLVPIVHSRVVEVLQRESLTGWDVYPVELYDRDDKRVDDYSGFCITGRCDSIYFVKDASSLVYEERKGGRIPYYQGLHASIDSWDNSDFFRAADRKTSYTLITGRARSVLMKNRVKNVLITPAADARSRAVDQPTLPRL